MGAPFFLLGPLHQHLPFLPTALAMAEQDTADWMDLDTVTEQLDLHEQLARLSLTESSFEDGRSFALSSTCDSINCAILAWRSPLTRSAL